MPSDAAGVEVRSISSVRDPAWEGWKRIYYDSFPPNERMTEGYFLGVLERKASGGEPDSHVLVTTPRGDPEDVIGMAYYGVEPELETGFLWYLATRERLRGLGLGTVLYEEIVRRVREAGARLLLFEVEMPELAREDGPEQAALAERRIAWYRRQGARLLGGVRYFQSVDAPVDPVQMHVMAHSLVPMSAEQVAAAAEAFFGDSLTRTGPPTLE